MPDQISPMDLDPQKVGSLLDLEAAGKIPSEYGPALAKLREMGALPPPKPQLPQWKPGAIPMPSAKPKESTFGGLDYTDYFNTPKEAGGPGIDTPSELGEKTLRGAAVGIPSTIGGIAGARWGPLASRAGSSLGAMIGQGGVETYDAMFHGGSEHPLRNIALAGGIGAVVPPPNGRSVESATTRKDRNQAFLEKQANPSGVEPNQVGVGAQDALVASHKAARDPLMNAYDSIMQGPLGKLEVIPAQTTRANVAGTSFQMAEPTTFAEMHAQSAELKAQARQAILSGDKANVARGFDLLKQVEGLNQQMREAATRAGQDITPYETLNSLYKSMNQQFDNKFMQQVRNKKASGLVDLIANPQQWKTFRMQGQGSAMDVPDLLRVMKDNVGPAAYSDLRSAVGKRILDQSMQATGEVNASALWNRLNRLNSAGVLTDLMPNGQRLMDAARILAKYQEGQVKAPTVFGRVFYKVASKMIEALDRPPDLEKVLTGLPKDHPITGALLRTLGVGAAAGLTIPSPPQSQ